MKSQMKAADRSGADLAVIVGPDEAAHAQVTLRRLRRGGDQTTLNRAQLVEGVRKWLAS
jgi:histidyl-tRNA synthetase